MLPERCWKRKLNVTSCSWQAKLGTLDTEKNYLLAIFTFVRGAEGDRATLPSSASRHGSVDASRLSLETEMERGLHAAGRRSWARCTRKKTTCLRFLFLSVA